MTTTEANVFEWEFSHKFNGAICQKMHVANYRVTEPTNYDQHGSYAADNYVVQVQPGVYPIYARRESGHLYPLLTVRMPATVVSKHNWNQSKPGDARDAHLSMYAYNAARHALEGSLGCVELLPGVEPREIHFEYKGEQLTTHGLFLKVKNREGEIEELKL